jgi:hypothetical protein
VSLTAWLMMTMTIAPARVPEYMGGPAYSMVEAFVANKTLPRN